MGRHWPVIGRSITVTGGTAPEPTPEPTPQPEPEAFVNPPNIAPQGGVFGAPVTATLSSIDGGSIYYTLDGSVPSPSSIEYTTSLVVTTTTRIRSVVQVAGGATSSERDATYVFGNFYAEDEWTSFAIASGDDSYVLEAVITPDLPGVDFVIGLGDAVISDYQDAAALVRFAQTGQIDVRNGDTYQAERVVTYEPDRGYRIRIEVDLTTKTYSVWIELSEGSLTRLAKDFAFRTEQANISEISTLGAISQNGPTGVTQLEALAIVPQETNLLLD